MCHNRPLIASYTKLRLHLRAVHRIHDRDFVYERDEPKFRHPFLFQADDRPITAHNIGHNFNAPLPTDEIMRVFSSVISDAIAGIVLINSPINQVCVQASVEPIFSSGNVPNRRAVSINADREMAVKYLNI